jgi:cardiolipin synthase A/B
MTLNQGFSAFNSNREFGIIDTNPVDVSEVAGVFEDDWNRTPPNLTDSRLVWSPVNSRQRILGLIDSANKTLRIENEEMQDNQTEDHLITAVSKGVNVEVVMSPGQTGNDANSPVLQKIEAGGVKVNLVKSPYIHAKIIVSDNSTAFIGSENFSPTSLDHNRELGILTQDPGVIGQLTTSFEKIRAATSESNIHLGRPRVIAICLCVVPARTTTPTSLINLTSLCLYGLAF